MKLEKVKKAHHVVSVSEGRRVGALRDLRDFLCTLPSVGRRERPQEPGAGRPADSMNLSCWAAQPVTTGVAAGGPEPLPHPGFTSSRSGPPEVLGPWLP